MEKSATEVEVQLIEDIFSFTHDPLGFVKYAFPWGSGALEGETGPDAWQTAFLKELGEKLKQGHLSGKEAVQFAVSSGNGSGKSALVSWLILWGMSTFEDCRGVVTANTEPQLRTKTWVELNKWHNLCICRHWFKLNATCLVSTSPKHTEIWRFDRLPWSANNAEAFAGLHNKKKRVLVLLDEASSIDDVIWESSEFALTDADTEMIWGVFGNPTRNSGRFFDCFHRFRHRWVLFQIDTRTCKHTNKKQIQKWVEDWGMDSDYVRVHVLGLFPNASDRQFIPTSYADAALGRIIPLHSYNFAPKVLTLDNAWDGGDEVVFGLRQGNAFKILKVLLKNDDDGVIAGLLMKFEDEEQADAVFIDKGYGTGVYSFGKQLGRNWILVEFGGESNDKGFLNKRAEMWEAGKKWLKNGGCIPDDKVLHSDLIGPEYEVIAHGKNAGKIMLETKKDMKARGIPSPNRADALMLSFAFPVKKKEFNPFPGKHKAQTHEEFNPLD
jgi:hypothetical protein